MEYTEILTRYYEARKLMYNALIHIMKNLPDKNGKTCNTIDFAQTQHKPVVLMENQYYGDCIRVTVKELILKDNTLYYSGVLTDFDDQPEVNGIGIDFGDGETCMEILNAIDDDILYGIEPYEPLPQTVLLCGYEEAKIYDEYWKVDDIEALKDLSQKNCFDIKRRRFLTKSERDAYIEGVYDAGCWEGIRLFENDNRFFDA